MLVREAFKKSLGLFENVIYRTKRKSLKEKAEDLVDQDAYNFFKSFADKSASILTQEDITQLIHYFQNRRWGMVRKTKKHIPNKFCWALACEISESKLTDLHPLKIIYPNINLFNEIEQASLKTLEANSNQLIEEELEKEKNNFITQRSLNINYMRLISFAEFVMQKSSELDFKYKLQPSQFVLCDDDIYPIKILDCLQLAEEDNTLKHTNKLVNSNGVAKEVPLSQTEILRVKYHSTLATHYFELIDKYNKDKKTLAVNSPTVEVAVENLITQLTNAGQNGGRDGTFYMPGVDWKYAVENFYAFLKTITPEQLQKFYACRMSEKTKVYKGRSFEICWKYLLYGTTSVIADDMGLTEKLNNLSKIKKELGKPDLEKEEKATNELIKKFDLEVKALNERVKELGKADNIDEAKLIGDFCIEQISFDLKNILENNRALLADMKPLLQSNDAKKICLKAEKDILNAQYAILEKRLRDPFVHRPINDLAYENATERLIKNVFPTVIQSLDKLIEVANDLEPVTHNELFEVTLGRNFLIALINNNEDLCKLLKSIKGNVKILLDCLGTNYLSSLINDSASLKKLFDVLTKKQCTHLITEVLGATYVNSLIDDTFKHSEIFLKMSYDKGKSIISSLKHSSKNEDVDMFEDSNSNHNYNITTNDMDAEDDNATNQTSSLTHFNLHRTHRFKRSSRATNSNISGNNTSENSTSANSTSENSTSRDTSNKRMKL